MTMGVCNPSVVKQGQADPRKSQPLSLAEMSNVRLSRKACVEGLRQGVTGGDLQAHLLISAPHTHASVHSLCSPDVCAHLLSTIEVAL